MKTKFILLLAVLYFNLNYSQKTDASLKAQKDRIKKDNNVPTQDIIYNYKTGEYDKNPKILRQNDPVVLKIININRLFYKPMVEGRDIENNDPNLSDTPTNTVLNKLEDYSLTKPESLNFTSIYSLFDAKPAESSRERKKDTEKITLESIYNNIISFKRDLANKSLEFNKNMQKLDSMGSIKPMVESMQVTISEESIGHPSKSPIVDKSNIKEKTDSITELNIKLETKIKEIQNSLFVEQANYALKLKQTESKNVLLGQLNRHLTSIDEKYNSFYEGAMEVQRIAKRYNNFIDKVNRPDFNSRDYKTMKINDPTALEKTTILNPDKIDSYYHDVSNFDVKYNNFLKEFSNPNFKNLIQRLYSVPELRVYMEFFEKDITKIKSSVEETYKNANNINLFNKLNQVEILDRELSQSENYTYISDPIQGKGDVLEFAVEIKPKNDYKEALAIYQPRKFTFSKYLRGGVRFDFGVGLSIDFKNNNEDYEVMVVQNINDTSRYLTAISNNSFLPKLVGMFHTSLRNYTNFTVGLSLGTALDVTNFDISSIYFGASAHFGRKDKLVITVGPSFMSAKQLKSTYRQFDVSAENRIGLPSDFQLSDGIYTQNYKIGFFAAVTYNLTSKQRATFMSAKQ